MAKAFDSIQTAREFALAGQAIVTLQSNKTGVHYTYLVQKPEDKNEEDKDFTPIWFVKVLSEGSVDEGQWTYIGMVRNGRFGVTKASAKMKDASCVKAFTYFMTTPDLSQLTVRHEGKCGRCGRTLTEPESIDSGLGPICRAAMGI